MFVYLEIENLKVVKNQNGFKTSDDQHFKAALYETKTITLLELPSLAPSIKTPSNTQKEVSIYVLILVLYFQADMSGKYLIFIILWLGSVNR